MVNLSPAAPSYDIIITGELDANGNAVTLPTAPFQFAVSDPSLGSFKVNPDGLSGTFTSSGVAGSGAVVMTDPNVPSVTAASSFTMALPPPPPPVPASIQFTESPAHA